METAIHYVKLNMHNYDIWSIDVYSALVRRSLNKAVDAKDGETVDAGIDKKAKAELLLSVEDYHKFTINSFATAKEAWDYLKETYTGESATRRSVLRRVSSSPALLCDTLLA